MQAYSKTDLYGKYVQEQSGEALQAGCITDDTYLNISQAHPYALYTPNYFIRIALALLTIVAVVFAGLLLFLLFSALAGGAIAMLLIIIGITCYIVLELLVKTKKYYNSGIDNILMILVALFIAASFFAYDYKVSWLPVSGVVMLICLWLCTRLADRFMAMLSYCFFFIFLFLLYSKGGDIAKTTSPFFMMGASAIVYFVMRKYGSLSFIYDPCFKAVIFLTLITFYASGNYFIVKELSIQMFPRELTAPGTILLGWLFWAFTFLIPLVYVIYGINKKDLLVMRTGLGLVAASVFTVKYYYTIFPAEIEMLIAGIILIALSYALIRYLKKPVCGFTSDEPYPAGRRALNAEALLITSTFTTGSKTPGTGNSGLYGGGSGGGGGATGQF